MKLRTIALSAAVFLAGCKINIQTPVGGEVLADGFACPSGQTCVIDANSTDFVASYVAEAYPGYRFEGWKEEGGYLCGGTTDPCVVNLRFFAGNPTLESFLLATANTPVYIEPIFVVDESTAPPSPVRYYPMDNGTLIDQISGLSGYIDGAIPVQDRYLAEDSALLMYNDDVNPVEPSGSIPGISVDSYLAMPGLQTPGDFTVSFFINAQNPYYEDSEEIIRVGDRIRVEINEDELILRFRGLSAREPNDVGLLLDDGNWHHMALSYSGELLSLYLDGEELMSVAAIGDPEDLSDILIPWVKGAMDDLYVFDTALDLQEIRQLADGWDAKSSELGWLPVAIAPIESSIDIGSVIDAQITIENTLNTASEALAIIAQLTESPATPLLESLLRVNTMNPLFPGTVRETSLTLAADKPEGTYYLHVCAFPTTWQGNIDLEVDLPPLECSESTPVELVDPRAPDLAAEAVSYSGGIMTIEVVNEGDAESTQGSASLMYTYIIDGPSEMAVIPPLAPGEKATVEIIDSTGSVDGFAENVSYQVCVTVEGDSNQSNNCASGNLADIFAYDLAVEIVSLTDRATIRVSNIGGTASPAGLVTGTIATDSGLSFSTNDSIPSIEPGQSYEYTSTGGVLEIYVPWPDIISGTFTACLTDEFQFDANSENNCDSGLRESTQ